MRTSRLANSLKSVERKSGETPSKAHLEHLECACRGGSLGPSPTHASPTHIHVVCQPNHARFPWLLFFSRGSLKTPVRAGRPLPSDFGFEEQFGGGGMQAEWVAVGVGP